MTMTDPIADMLTRIRNANAAMHDTVKMPSSKLKESLADILESEGTSAASTSPRRPTGPGSVLEIKLKYAADRTRTIGGLRRVSKPGLRIYAQADQMPRVLGGMGVAVLSTSQGLMTDREARSAASAGRCSVMSGEHGQRASAADRRGGPLMSRVGRSPIAVPGGVTVTVDGTLVTVTGPQGTLARPLPGAITVRQEDANLIVERPDDQRQNRALHGLTRRLVANMVDRVTAGFTKELEIVGVGYRAAARGRDRSSWRSGSPIRSSSTRPTASPSRSPPPPGSS